jgi:hypothetical protein
MTTEQFLAEWRTAGAISVEQFDGLSALVRKERFSVFLELNALLYLGVVSFVTGLGWTVHEHFASLGDAAILIPLAVLFAGCLYYAFTRGRSYSPGQVASPSFAFDYVLYLGCLVFAVALGYIEFRFHLLKENWDAYLLASTALYLALAYRFDNRFVLSLALSTLAAWFGVRFSHRGLFIAGSMRELALEYGAVVSLVGVWMRRLGIKSHFLEAYLHVAANAVLIALTSGVIDGDSRWLWLLGLLIASGVAVERGVQFKRFAFVVYGVVYGYVGVSAQVLRSASGLTPALSYLLFSGAAVVISLVVMARRFGREE